MTEEMVCHPISLSHRYWKQKISPSLFLECFIPQWLVQKMFSKSFYNNNLIIAMKGLVPGALPLGCGMSLMGSR